jgi:hypothetical protein
MDKELLSKIQRINKQKNVNIFASPKVREWCPYILNIIINQFPKYKIVRNVSLIHNVDIIITHIKHNIEYFSDNAINIVISGENYMTKKKYDISISTLSEFNSYYNIYLPFLYMSLKEHKLSISSNDFINSKNNFCAFMYSYSFKHRLYYFDLVNSYMRVDAMGDSCNNTNISSNRSLYNGDMTFLDEAIQIYKDYKFVLAIENKMIDGYITEKIINPLIAGSIPIYWGTNKIFEFINKDRIIYALDYDNGDELLRKIKEINENDELFDRIVNEPIYCIDKDPEHIFKQYETEISTLFSS